MFSCWKCCHSVCLSTAWVSQVGVGYLMILICLSFLFPGSIGLWPRSAFQSLSKPFKAWAKVNPLKIAGQTSLALCYLYKLISLLASSTIPPVLRFTLLVGRVCVGWLRTAPISPSQLPMESMGSEPGQLPLAVNCKKIISLKTRSILTISRMSQKPI